jgi:signal transduction histidine kinase
LLASALIRPWASLPTAGLISVIFTLASFQAGTPNFIFGSAALFVVAVASWRMLASLEHSLCQQRLLRDEAQRLAQEATAANQAKSSFLANMSHELRTPLNGVLGYIQILSRREDLASDDQVRQGLNVIRQSGEHLLTLINDLLDLAKVEAGRLELAPAPLHLPTFLSGVAGIMRARAIQKNVQFVYLANTLPLGVLADEKRLRQVLLNLLGNAVKFTEKGGKMTLGVTVAGITTTSVQIRFEVSDTGIGMKPEQVSRLFRPFEQVSEMKYRAEGTGLGLALSQQLVGLMGGQIRVQSQYGKGSRFSFDVSLPLTEVSLETVSGFRFPSGYRGSKRKVLVADDRPENRLVLRNLLEPLGFAILEAENGEQAILTTERERPDLILMDLVMPEVTGYEAARRIRDIPTVKDTVIIAVSASAYDDDRIRSLTVCNAFVPKPIMMEQLVPVVAQQAGVEWVYPARPEKPVVGAGVEFPLPNTAIVTQIRDLLAVGDFQAVIDLGKKLEGDMETKAFGSRLKSLALAFAENEILEWIEGEKP